MIKRYVEAYKFENLKFNSVAEYKYSENGFIIKLRLTKLPAYNAELLNINRCIKITQRVLTPEDKANMSAYEISECYFQKTYADGSVPVIEAEINLSSPNHPDWKTMKLGINLLMYDISEKDLYIVYDTVNFRLVYDGIVINNNMPFGTLQKPESSTVKINTEYSAYIEYSNDISKAEYYRTSETINKKLNFYTPKGHNIFIGDVVNFYHSGVYHLLYMPDRHHHGNRWGGGGHHFEHMITRNFIDWEDVGPIWDISEQWQSTGTGTMFFHNKKYYVAYGLHTGRTIDEDKLYSREMQEYILKNHETEIVSFDELKINGFYPSGASYSVSNDGIHFSWGEKVFSPCENPSIYSENGRLIMYAGYGDGSVWQSTDIDKPWKPLNALDFKCGEASAMRNTSECPSFFEWNGYKYLIMGVTGFWRTEKNSDEYIDYASKGIDVYEGLSVPMAAKTDDNRVILAGWIGGMGWGSMVIHRELIQYKNGDIGMKWLPELFPDIYEIPINRANGENIRICEKCSYYFEAVINPENRKTADIRFIDRNSEVCELKLNFERKTAQYGSCSVSGEAADILPMCEAINTVKQTDYGFNLLPESLPHKCKDFAIAHVKYPEEHFKVKILIYYSEKNNYTIIDTEIAETRTLITCRKDFLPTNIKLSNNISNEKLFNAEL